MSLVIAEELGRLVKASGSFGRSKSLVVNFHNGYTYIHMYSGASRITLELDEYKHFGELAGEIKSLDQRFKEQVCSTY